MVAYQQLGLIDVNTGAIYTFSTASIGGRIACQQLADQVALMRGLRANAVAEVALQTTEMKTKFGNRPRPSFKVVGWKEGSELPALEPPSAEN